MIRKFIKFRLVIATVMAPLSLPIIFFLVNYALRGEDGNMQDYLPELLYETMSPVLPLSYLFSILLGFFVGILIYKINKPTAPYIISLSALIGMVSGITFPWIVFKGHSDNSSIMSSIVYGLEFGGAGLIVSTAYCMLIGSSSFSKKN